MMLDLPFFSNKQKPLRLSISRQPCQFQVTKLRTTLTKDWMLSAHTSHMAHLQKKIDPFLIMESITVMEKSMATRTSDFHTTLWRMISRSCTG